jgi:hypothetical protein
MTVELDVFSGRPNPRWELDEDSAESLRLLISGLPPATGVPQEPSGLGYRGFVFTTADGPARAYGGYIITPGAVLADPSSRIERFLLDRLPPELEKLRRRVPLVDGGVDEGAS